MTKSEKIIFRVTPGKNEQYKQLAESKGFKNISELMLDALQEYEGKHLDPVREVHRLAAEIARFMKRMRQEPTTHEREQIMNVMQNSLDNIKLLPVYSEAYMRDFENE